MTKISTGLAAPVLTVLVAAEKRGKMANTRCGG